MRKFSLPEVAPTRAHLSQTVDVFAKPLHYWPYVQLLSLFFGYLHLDLRSLHLIQNNAHFFGNFYETLLVKGDCEWILRLIKMGWHLLIESLLGDIRFGYRLTGCHKHTGNVVFAAVDLG